MYQKYFTGYEETPVGLNIVSEEKNKVLHIGNYVSLWLFDMTINNDSFDFPFVDESKLKVTDLVRSLYGNSETSGIIKWDNFTPTPGRNPVFEDQYNNLSSFDTDKYGRIIIGFSANPSHQYMFITGRHFQESNNPHTSNYALIGNPPGEAEALQTPLGSIALTFVGYRDEMPDVKWSY